MAPLKDAGNCSPVTTRRSNRPFFSYLAAYLANTSNLPPNDAASIDRAGEGAHCALTRAENGHNWPAAFVSGELAGGGTNGFASGQR